LEAVFMLEQLRRIVLEVNEAPDLERALAIIVRRVKQSIGADVCSVYLTDFEKREHVLQATDSPQVQCRGARAPAPESRPHWPGQRARGASESG
jgi:GAF domain-containing protein